MLLHVILQKSHRNKYNCVVVEVFSCSGGDKSSWTLSQCLPCHCALQRAEAQLLNWYTETSQLCLVGANQIIVGL